MTRAGAKRSYYEGRRLIGEIILHRPTPKGEGGTTASVYGSKGSGKTTLLLTIAQKVAYIDIDTGKLKKETVIWRGRELDYWLYLPTKQTTLFIHKNDENSIKFVLDTGDPIDLAVMPPIIYYTSCKDLYSKLKRHEYNVVYEPMTYQLTDSVKKLVRARGSSRKDLFENVDIPPVIFWFEMFDWLIHKKEPEPLTIIFDEADELLPVTPAGARWYLNLWAKERIKDFRRRNISLLLATHGYQDIDGRILVKIQYKVYMKGCTTPSVSLIDRHAPILLDKGIYYIEKDAWGMSEFDKLRDRPIVITSWGDDDIGEGDDEDGGPDDGVPPGVIPTGIDIADNNRLIDAGIAAGLFVDTKETDAGTLFIRPDGTFMVRPKSKPEIAVRKKRGKKLDSSGRVKLDSKGRIVIDLTGIYENGASGGAVPQVSPPPPVVSPPKVEPQPSVAKTEDDKNGDENDETDADSGGD